MTLRRLFAMLCAFLGGGSMVVQSRINGELGVRFDNGYAAALVSFGGGLIVLIALTLVLPRSRRGIRTLVTAFRSGDIPWWHLCAGVIGAWFVIAQGLTVGVLGVAAFTIGTVAGQTISGLLVDRIGFGVLAPRAITLNRVAGALIAIIAVSLTVIVGSAQVGPAIWLVVLPFVGGALQPLQQAILGGMQRKANDVVTPSLVNFTLGTLVITLAFAVTFLGGMRITELPTEWWLYTGGLIGAVFIAVAAVVVQILGTLLMSLVLVAGQVVSALIIDLVLPAQGHEVTVWSFVSAALTVLAVVVSSWRRFRKTAKNDVLVSPRA